MHPTGGLTAMSAVLRRVHRTATSAAALAALLAGLAASTGCSAPVTADGEQISEAPPPPTVTAPAAEPPISSEEPTAQDPPTPEPTPEPAPTSEPPPTSAPDPADPPDPTFDLNAQAARLQPCYLLPLPEVARITGIDPYYPPMGLSEPQVPGDYLLAFCEAGPAARVEVYLPPDSEALQPRIAEAAALPGSPQDGLGERAIWHPEQGLLDIETGEAWVRVAIYADQLPGQEALGTARALAELALGRLAAALSGTAARLPIPEQDLCKLLEREEAERILGPLHSDPGVDGAFGPEGQVLWCFYDGALGMAQLSYVRFATPEGAHWYFSNETYRGGEPLALGDAAAWDASSQTLRVLRGDVRFFVMLSGQEDGREAAEQIARIAVERLP